ncbi:MAG: ABC transporter ATP-binding protein [Candidatus Adiutrix sp.]|jgi:iron complex transport system ATP-binding protein|nr:ABC transporter ATP-binding protein [Candidatus Adiutrix sp.]
MAGKTLMSVHELSFAYGRRTILHEISLNLRGGRLRGLLGPNGSGKTTLFKCCLGFLKVARGQIELEGRSIAEYSPRELAARVAYVPQEHRPAFPYTVREMVEMGRTPHRGAIPALSKADHRAVDQALARLNLTALANENYNHLSGGQRQLVLVARALAQEAALLFLDEPTSSLDFSNQLIVWEAVQSIAREGLGAIICCHDPNHILWFCDEAAAIKDGRILAEGPAREIITRGLLEELYDRPIQTADLNGRSFIYPLTSPREANDA